MGFKGLQEVEGDHMNSSVKPLHHREAVFKDLSMPIAESHIWVPGPDASGAVMIDVHGG